MTVRPHPQRGPRPDWGVSPHKPVGLIATGAAIGAVLCAAGALVGWFITGLLGAAAGAIAVAVVIALGTGAQRRWLLGATGARPLEASDAPRVTNLVTGRAGSEGVAVPKVMVFDRPDPNAFIWGGRRPLIALSRGAVEGFTRTEIEAVVTHCFARLSLGAGRALPIAVLVGRLAARTGPLVTTTEDVVAAASTRYPPALRSALAKCSPAHGTLAPAFFVAEGWSHTPVAQRIHALEDL